MTGLAVARKGLEKKYEDNRARWLGGEGAWPLTFSLGEPSEDEALRDLAAVREWAEEWGRQGDVVEWTVRRWRKTGTEQRLPVRLRFASAAEITAFIGRKAEWATATLRRAAILDIWPQARGAEVRLRNLLFRYEQTDFEIMVSLVVEVARNPVQGKTLRQVSVAGMHTKWLEKEKHSSDFKAIYSVATGIECEGSIEDVLGLKKSPMYFGIRVLCERLRRYTGGLRSFDLVVEDLAALSWEPERCLLVENDQTFHALEDQPGTVVILARGNSVGRLTELQWHPRRALYWGDLDTHGFFILNEARRAFPTIVSVLMDEATLVAHRRYWVKEKDGQKMASDGTPYADRLTPSEKSVYEGLLNGSYARAYDFTEGPVRLEQERIAWEHSRAVIERAWEG